MKRIYLITDVDMEYYVAVIQSSVKQAKNMGLRYFPESEFIELRVKWLKKEIDISKYPIGYDFGYTEKRLIEGLKLGIYDYLEYIDCPKCYNNTLVNHVDHEPFYLCNNCIEKN